MKSPTKSAASFYPQTTNAKGQPLSVSFLNNSKEDVHGVVDENSYVVDKEGKRRLIMEERNLRIFDFGLRFK